ncbi:hypothetical protein STANM309S_02808 [Streptomyces tanashiensis]
MGEAPRVLELQVRRIVQVDVRLGRSVDREQPGPLPVHVGHEARGALVDLADDGDVLVHALIVPGAVVRGCRGCTDRQPVQTAATSSARRGALCPPRAGRRGAVRGVEGVAAHRLAGACVGGDHLDARTGGGEVGALPGRGEHHLAAPGAGGDDDDPVVAGGEVGVGRGVDAAVDPAAPADARRGPDAGDGAARGDGVREGDPAVLVVGGELAGRGVDRGDQQRPRGPVGDPAEPPGDGRAAVGLGDGGRGEGEPAEPASVLLGGAGPEDGDGVPRSWGPRAVRRARWPPRRAAARTARRARPARRRAAPRRPRPPSCRRSDRRWRDRPRRRGVRAGPRSPTPRRRAPRPPAPAPSASPCASPSTSWTESGAAVDPSGARGRVRGS